MIIHGRSKWQNNARTMEQNRVKEADKGTNYIVTDLKPQSD